MEKVVRAFPITSKDELLKMAEGVTKFSVEQKKPFFDNFSDAVEDWYYQELAGKPYVIAVAQGEDLEKGFANYQQLNDEFSLWFKAQVQALTAVDLNAMAKGPESEHIFCFDNQCAAQFTATELMQS